MSKETRKVAWSLELDNMRVRAGGFVSDAVGGAAEAKTASLSEPRAGAAAALIEIAFPAGRATLGALAAGSPNLFEAELRYVGEYEYQASGGAERRVSLRQTAGAASGFGGQAAKAQNLRWGIQLARNLPIQLRLTGGVGEADIDLNGVQLAALQLQTGVGNLQLRLPATGDPLACKIRGGVGQTDISVPAGAWGALDIIGGLGGVAVSVASDATVRVEAKRGLGALEAPEGFVRVAGGEKAKSLLVWQSADYADAAQTLIVRCAAGLGRFRVVATD